MARPLPLLGRVHSTDTCTGPTASQAHQGAVQVAPRDFAERIFDVHAFRQHAVGGHFAAWQQADVSVHDVAIAAGRAH